MISRSGTDILEKHAERGKFPGRGRSGNRCGHDPKAPRLEPESPVARNLPPVILQVCDRFQQYYDNPDLLPLLNAVNGSLRRQRSERREAIVLTFLQLMKHYNLLTGRSEIPVQGGQLSLTVAWIARQAGLGIKRAYRAMKDLQLAGILQIRARSKLTSQGYRGVAAIKLITDHIFRAFGLLDELKRQVRHKEQALAMKTQRLINDADPQPAAREHFLNALRSKVRKPFHGGHSDKQREVCLEHQKRQIQIRCLELRQQEPDLPPSDIRRLAAMQLAREALR